MLKPSDLTIIYPPAIDYKFMYQRPHQIMKAFSQLGANVLYMNPANIYPQTHPVEIPFPNTPNFKVLSPAANIREYMHGETVLWCPVGRDTWIDTLRPKVSIFDSCDLAENEFARHRAYIPAMEKKATIIFASAKAILEDHQKRREDVYLLPNGADFTHFRKASTRIGASPYPAATPIIGYYGAIYHWMDVEMVEKIADHYSVVLIGASKLYNKKFRHKNVAVLSMKDYDDLPYYLSWMDCTIIPFKLTKMIQGCNPVKFYEYLSAGKPIVASQMNELKPYKELCYLTDNNNVVGAVQKALRENGPNKQLERQAMAQQNTWLIRAKEALRIIRSYL